MQLSVFVCVCLYLSVVQYKKYQKNNKIRNAKKIKKKERPKKNKIKNEKRHKGKTTRLAEVH